MSFGFVGDWFDSLTHWVAGLEPWQQVAALLLMGAIPFIESYMTSFIGVILDVNPFLAVPAAIIGNILCTFLLIAFADRARTAVTRNRQVESAEQPSKSRQKVEKFMQRFGVPGVSLFGPFVAASQITAPALIALGAKSRSVYLWSGISIIIWGVTWGLFAAYLLSLVAE